MEWSGKGSSISLPEVWLKVSENMNEWINKWMNIFLNNFVFYLNEWIWVYIIK